MRAKVSIIKVLIDKCKGLSETINGFCYLYVNVIERKIVFNAFFRLGKNSIVLPKNVFEEKNSILMI